MNVGFQIVEHIGVIDEGSGGWRTELNRVSWNGRPAKLDLRSWNEDHSQAGKGLTLTQEAAETLRTLLHTV